MSNVGYDLDTSGGLMPLIRALIKPPDEDLSTQKTKKPQHPYYKRPGKGHNHDSCDACGEGGDLICCDRCPASFHLGCYDPPLDENDIPSGLWLCRECEAADVEKPSSTRGSRAQSPADNKSDTEKKNRTLRNSRANSTKKSKDMKEKVEEPKKEEEKELSPMEVLVKAARIMNPRQFELPREMRIPLNFPGTEKDDGSGCTLISVDSAGCVPIPAKLCFVCQGTCKHAPLLQCDYCPLLYHQDCLDPPLTALPTGRWMCPNHVEQYIDWKLVNSISATERVALWDKFSAPVDQHAVKIDFIRHARKPSPHFRLKVPAAMRGRVVVPEMVREHYRHPPPLLPSRREYVRCRNVLRNQQSSGDAMSDEEETKRKICLNLECPQYSGGRCPHDDDQQKNNDEQMAVDEDEHDQLKSESDSESRSRSPSPVVVRGRGESPRVTTRRLLAAARRQLRRLDAGLVTLLAWQRLQQVACGEQCWGAWRRLPLSLVAARAVRGSIDRGALRRLGVRHVPLPSELLGAAERSRIAAAVLGHPPHPQPTDAHKPHKPANDAHHMVTVKAVLAQVERPARSGLGDGIGQLIAMRLSRLTVGTDPACGVSLPADRCTRVSAMHAVIFCDEVTRHFELINYSQWGTRVNGVLYACDISHPPEHSIEKTSPADKVGQPDTPGQEDDEKEKDRDPPAVVELTELVKRRMPQMPETLPSEPSCACGGGAACGAWEGSALLNHGALLQFGCHMYVFCLPEVATGEEEEC